MVELSSELNELMCAEKNWWWWFRVVFVMLKEFVDEMFW